MISDKFFEYGYPDDPAKPHYGLYQPVLDRFVFTIDDLEIAKKIKDLMSSRFSLYIFDLTLAENHAHTLLDNTCCENWSIDNKQDIRLTHSYRDESILKPNMLIPVDRSCDWDLQAEKDWMQAIWHWSLFQSQLENVFYPWYRVEQFVDQMLLLDTESNYRTISEFGNLTKSLFYLERDYATVISKIKSTIESSDILKKGYESWPKKLSI
jgi:hypothetical protein